jgi:hypothetical protein
VEVVVAVIVVVIVVVDVVVGIVIEKLLSNTGVGRSECEMVYSVVLL